MEKQTFAELGISPDLLKAIEALGFEQPAPIQAQAIPPGIEGRDVVGQSQTGSGKTWHLPSRPCNDWMCKLAEYRC
jgi:ATP-dependent RNA helicase DeaD